MGVGGVTYLHVEEGELDLTLTVQGGQVTRARDVRGVDLGVVRRLDVARRTAHRVA